MLSFLFGSRGLRPDLPSPFGRKFLFCLLACSRSFTAPGLTTKMAENLVEVPDDDGFLDSLEAFAISSSAPVDPKKTRGNKRMLKKAKKKPAKFIKTKPKTATKSKKKLETEKRKELADLLEFSKFPRIVRRS